MPDVRLLTDSTGSTVWVKNAFTCFNLESKNIMCLHDCFWNCSTPGALSEVIANTLNDTNLFTTSEEEFDYTLIGMDTQPRITPSEWTKSSFVLDLPTFFIFRHFRGCII
jgi:hypothetical protein